MTNVVALGNTGLPPLQIEYQWVGTADDASPLIVFLHEGLGSVACGGTFRPACVKRWAPGPRLSRPGYGPLDATPARREVGVDFMHLQAREVLPALLTALGINAATDKPWLFGHSDGGSIALIHAALFPGSRRGRHRRRAAYLCRRHIRHQHRQNA